MFAGGSQLEEIEDILKGPRGVVIRLALDTMAALKLGFKLTLEDVEADVFAVMRCFEEQRNQYEVEQSKKNGIAGN